MTRTDYVDLKYKLCDELQDIKDNKALGMAEIEIIDKLTHTIKSINAILSSEVEDGRDGYYPREYANMEAYPGSGRGSERGYRR